MQVKTFKRLLNLFVALYVSLVVKTLLFPYAIAPQEFAKAISLYDEMQEAITGFELIFLFLSLILLIVSIVQLYRLKANGRLLFLISVICLNLSILVSGYYVLDTLEYLLDAMLGILMGVILCAIYYTDLSKKFKK